VSRCNLRCPNCDTPYTWDWRRFDPRVESRRVAVSEVAAWVERHAVTLVVISGGEPLLQQRHLLPLVERLARDGRQVGIETNGTVAPDPALTANVAAYNVSPKVGSFAHPDDDAIRPRALARFAASGKAVFKFVVAGPADLDAVAAIVEAHGLAPVWVMPTAASGREVLDGLRSLADETQRRGWNLTGRLHLLLWEDARGR
jgi:organic radical activating enzyme